MEDKWSLNSVLDLRKIEKIPIFDDPLRARYVSPDVVVISDVNGCYLQNLKTEEINCIDDTRGCYRLGTQQLECKNEKIFVSNYRRIMIYDTQTNKVDWSTRRKRFTESVAWDHAHNIVFICYGDAKRKITTYDYATNIHKDIAMKDKACRLMTIDSDKQIMCISDNTNTISFHALDNLALVRKAIVLPDDGKRYIFCQYSPDGGYVISGNKKKLYILDSQDKKDIYLCLDVADGEEFNRIAFHPNKSVLATSNTLYAPSNFHGGRQQLIRYWDLKTQQCIYKTSDLISMSCYDLSFSQDGLQVIAALDNKCIRMHAPLVMKDKCLYLLFILKQIYEKHNIPKDIIFYGKNLLWRSLHFDLWER